MVHALNGALAIRLKLVGAPFSPFDFFPSGPYLRPLHVLVYISLFIVFCNLNIFHYRHRKIRKVKPTVMSKM